MGEGQRLAHAGGGDHVAVDHHGAVPREGARGEGSLEAGEARGLVTLEYAEFRQDEGCGANGGDVLGSSELAHQLTDALVGAKVGGAGQAAGQHDVVVFGEIDLVERDVACDGNLLGGDDVARIHDRDEGGVDAAATQDIDDGQAFDGLKTIGGKYGNSGHGKSSHLDAAMPELYPIRPCEYQPLYARVSLTTVSQ